MVDMSWIRRLASRAPVCCDRSCETFARRQGCWDTWTLDGREDMLGCRSESTVREVKGQGSRTRTRKVDKEYVIGGSSHNFKEAEYRRSKLMVSMLR
jgi:hypothetical protein